MAEYSRLAQGKFTALTDSAGFAVALPFLPDYVKIINTTAIAAGSGVYSLEWERDMGDGAAVVNTADVLSYVSSTTGTGIRPFSAGLGQQMGPVVLLGSGGSITAASPPLITTTADHGLSVGDVIIFQNLYETATTGMQQMAGIPFKVVTAPTTKTFTVDWVASGGNYTALAAGGLQPTPGVYIAGFRKVLYPVLYAPNQTVVSNVAVATDGINTKITTASYSNVQVGQQVAFHIPSVWGADELNSLPNALLPASPKYFYVIDVVDADNFVVQVPFASLTAFNANQPFLSFPGLKLPQVVSVGDVNSGGFPYTGAQLYPSPTVFNGFQGSVTVPMRTINGPAIQGAFINATMMGFLVGTAMDPTADDELLWQAFMMDINYP